MSLCLSKTACADQALVIGNNEYPGLRPESNLSGCVNDAGRMATALQKYHFTVTTLTNSHATKKGILSALEKMRGIRPDERFVFYFAGHGTHGRNGMAVLLPNDASDASDANDLRADELFQAVQAIPARARVVILDSCHSGGMMRSTAKSLQKLTSRYYQRSGVAVQLQRQGKAFEEEPVNNRDMPRVGALAANGQNGICYYAACRGCEVSSEKEQEDGKPDGVFTYRLTSLLNGQNSLWKDLSASINKLVADDTDDLQHPTISPAFLGKPLFDVGEAVAKTSTLADVYSAARPEPAQISLEMVPNLTPLPAGSQIQFVVKTGSPGYLVILGRDATDNLYVIYPYADAAEDGGVGVNAVVTVPRDPKKRLASHTPGTERVKAFLFTQPQDATQLLRAMRAVGGAKRSAPRKTALSKLEAVAASTTPFYTAELMVEITPAEEAKK